MPVFTIEAPSGHRLRIEAADEATALRGAQEWHAQQNASTADKVVDEAIKTPGAIRQGIADVASGIGATGKAIGLGGQPLQDFADAVAPDQQRATDRFLNPQPGDTTVAGYGVGSIPRAIAESLPALASDVTATRVGGRIGGARGAIAGGLLSYLARSYGNEAQEAANKRTGKEGADLTGADHGAALASVIPGAALNQIAAGKLAGKGAAKAGTSARNELGKKIGLEAGTEGGQEFISQGATSYNAPGGMDFDPHKIGGAAILGGATAGTISGPRAVVDASTARRTKDIDQDAAAEFAERIQAHAGKKLGNAKADFKATQAAESDVFNELANAVKADPATKQAVESDTAASNALNRVSKHQQVDDVDLDHIDRVTRGTPNGAAVTALARQAKVAQQIKALGSFDESAGTFSGGVSTQLDKGLRFFKNPVAALATSGAGLYTLGAYSPQVMAALTGTYIGARGLDKFTGRRSPAKTIVERYAGSTQGGSVSPTVPQAAAPAAPQAAPAPVAARAAPWGPRPPQTVPSIPQAAQPAPPAPRNVPVPPGFEKWLQATVANINNADAFADKQTVAEAAPLLRKLAAARKAQMAAAQNAPAPAPEPEPAVQDIPAFLKSHPAPAAEAAPAPVAAPEEPIDIPAFLKSAPPAPVAAPAPAPAPVVTENTKLVKDVARKIKVSKKEPAKEPAKPAPAPTAAAKTLPFVSADEPGIPDFLRRTPDNKLPSAAPTTLREQLEASVELAKAEKPAVAKKAKKGEEPIVVPADYALPKHDKAHLSPRQGAEAIADQWEADGKKFWGSRESFIDAIEAALVKKNDLANRLQRAAPGIDFAPVKGALWATKNRSEAKILREFLASQAASKTQRERILEAMNEEAIKAIWRKIGK